MAVGINNEIDVNLRKPFGELRKKYPHHHILMWMQDGVDFKPIPGARWIKHDKGRLHSYNPLARTTCFYEYYVILAGTFQCTDPKLTKETAKLAIAKTEGAHENWSMRQYEFKLKEDFGATWMKYLDEDLSLESLTLPGTRRSSAVAKDVTEAWLEPNVDHDDAVKENMLLMHMHHEDTIRKQLHRGIRLLELGCSEGHDFIAYDDLTIAGQEVENALATIKKFLEVNGSETVLVLFSRSCAHLDCTSPKTSFDAHMRELFSDRQTFYVDTKWPTLREAKGKIVVLRGWNSEPGEDWCLDFRPVLARQAGVPQYGCTAAEISSAADLVEARWKQITSDLESKHLARRIVLGACLRHGPTDDRPWILHSSTASRLQTKMKEHINKRDGQMKGIWFWGDFMREETNAAIAKLNHFGPGDHEVSRSKSIIKRPIIKW
ncbi:hypothetical protein CPLU01_01776 [Colletotrichum plurivorum]|uniref:Phosphatidylinositol-specific phospholipase C X domain-containing protein n=1 Tax=Colletotrichum plurivorum TaxID=2175906 RepID=A0A8H6NNM5_9PEZI|nr:hypothetical protein CPLU01_01776 [Colletotrichum plurivorum]